MAQKEEDTVVKEGGGVSGNKGQNDRQRFKKSVIALCGWAG